MAVGTYLADAKKTIDYLKGLPKRLAKELKGAKTVAEQGVKDLKLVAATGRQEKRIR